MDRGDPLMLLPQMAEMVADNAMSANTERGL